MGSQNAKKTMGNITTTKLELSRAHTLHTQKTKSF